MGRRMIMGTAGVALAASNILGACSANAPRAGEASPAPLPTPSVLLLPLPRQPEVTINGAADVESQLRLIASGISKLYDQTPAAYRPSNLPSNERVVDISYRGAQLALSVTIRPGEQWTATQLDPTNINTAVVGLQGETDNSEAFNFEGGVWHGEGIMTDQPTIDIDGQSEVATSGSPDTNPAVIDSAWALLIDAAYKKLGEGQVIAGYLTGTSPSAATQGA